MITLSTLMGIFETFMNTMFVDINDHEFRDCVHLKLKALNHPYFVVLKDTTLYSQDKINMYQEFDII